MTTTYNTDIHAAIERSSSHNEVVTILAADSGELAAIVGALYVAAGDADIDGTETPDLAEVWAVDLDTGAILWRIHVATSTAR
jgi:outer membrane protein assembly factor BamB